MSKIIASTFIFSVFMMLAMPMFKGMPEKHGVDGKTFGYLVSSLAQSEPGAVADHVSN